MHLDGGHLADPQRPIGVEVSLLHAAAHERDLVPERGGQPVADAALHLRTYHVGIDRGAAVDGADDTLDLRQAVGAARDLDHLRDDAVEGLVHGHAARAPARQRLAPARSIGCKVQRREMPRVLGEQRAAQVDGIASHRVRKLVEERFRRVRGVRTTDRAPPEHRHADPRRVEIHGDVRNGVRKIRGALDRRPVDAVFHHRRLEGRAARDRLADDAMLPADDIARGVETTAQAMHVEWPIPAALDVVFACPHELDGAITADGLRDGRRFAGNVAVGRGAAAEAAPSEQRVHTHRVGRYADDLRDDLLIDRRSLRACPEVAAVGADADDRVQRLHRRVRQIGELVHRLQDSRRAAQGAVGVAFAPCAGARPTSQHAIRRVELVRAALLRTALVPRHAQRLAAFAGRPEALRHHGHTRRHRHDVRHALHPARGRRVERLHGGAEARRSRDQRRQHPRHGEVHRVLRRAVGLGPAVHARRLLADELEVLRILERHLRGQRARGSLRRQLTERRAAARWRMGHDATIHGDLRGGDAPFTCGGLDEHGARRGAGAPHLVPGIGHRRAAARDLSSAQQPVTVARGVRGSRLDANLGPVGVELFGQDRGDPTVAALAELDVLADDRDRVVGSDADESIGRKPLDGGRRAAVETDADDERGAGERRGLEEATTSEHAQAPSVVAASWIAARMRT